MAIIDPAPEIPDEADPSTWTTRQRQRAEWQNQLGNAVNLLSPFINAYPAIVAQTNFIGNWDDQTGAKTVPTSVYHDGEFWILLEDTADITADEPGVSAKWVSFPSPTKDLSLRVFSTAISAFDFTLPAEYRRFVLQVENCTHDGSVARSLGVGFSTDDGTSYTAPVAISALVDAGDALDDDVEFYLSPNSARSLQSSQGHAGMIVPAGANRLRLVSCKAGRALDRLAPISGSARILLTGYRGV